MTRRLECRRKSVSCSVLATLLIIGFFSRQCVFRPAANFLGSHYNRNSNAAWLDITWSKDPHDRADVEVLVGQLARRRISYAFVYVSYLRSDGQFNPTYSQAADFVRVAKSMRSDLNLQAWIGLPLKRSEASAFPANNVDLGDDVTRSKIAAFSAKLVHEIGFDGIHLDPEPVESGDRQVLRLLEELRAAIGPSATLSIAALRIRPVFAEVSLPLATKLVWSSAYYREVASRVDQLAVMVYDSGLPLPQLYRHWTRFQVIGITRALEGMNVDLFFGVPTSEERTRTHWPSAENMVSGLEGIVDGLNDSEARPSMLRGVAIYPDWETDENEWAFYERLWLGQQP